MLLVTNCLRLDNRKQPEPPLLHIPDLMSEVIIGWLILTTIALMASTNLKPRNPRARASFYFFKIGNSITGMPTIVRTTINSRRIPIIIYLSFAGTLTRTSGESRDSKYTKLRTVATMAII